MTTIADLDAPPKDVFDGLYKMPEFIEQSREYYQELFDAMVLKLRREAAGLPMSTMQLLLIERLASTYILIRYNEDLNAWKSPGHERDVNAHWLNMEKEFSKLIAQGEDKRREQLLYDIVKVVNTTLEMIDDHELKLKVRNKMVAEFAALDV